MKPNYNDLPFEFFSPGKGRLCERRGTKCDFQFPRHEPPLVSRPPRIETLWLEMDATSQISREARDAIIDNVQTGLGGIDLGLNRKRARDNAQDNFLYRTDKEI